MGVGPLGRSEAVHYVCGSRSIGSVGAGPLGRGGRGGWRAVHSETTLRQTS